MKSQLYDKAVASVMESTSFLTLESIFGKLQSSAVFKAAYSKAYKDITKNGVEQCVININTKN